MTVDVVLPQLGESMTEATIGRWLKRVGDRVEKYEPLLEVETDKVSTEVPAIASGTLIEILAPEGTILPVGAILARISDVAGAPTHDSPGAVRSRRPGGPPVTPVVARLAAEHGIALDQVQGTGAGGRISKKDVLRYIEQRASAPPPAVESRVTLTERGLPPAPMQEPLHPPQDADVSITPLSAMRRAIAEHMVRSVQEAPQATTVFEVDMGRVVSHREHWRDSYARQGVRLTITAYIIQAVAAALRRLPALNARYSDAGIITSQHIHVGVAVALEDGLIVPVVRDADEKSLAGIARALGDLVERARMGRLQPGETEGGTFSITNHGVGGSLFATPILNRGQSGILGVGAIVRRPVVLDHDGLDVLAVRPMCYLSLTFDHRVCDGATADAFLAAVKAVLETYADE